MSNTDRLSRATALIFDGSDFGLEQLPGLLGLAAGTGVDYADLYFQVSAHEVWSLENGIVRDASFNAEKGVGVRILSGEKAGFSFSNDIALQPLKNAISAARAIARSGQSGAAPVLNASSGRALYTGDNPLLSMAAGDKVALLQQFDALARQLDPAIVEVTLTLSAVHEAILVAATDGTLAADIRPLIRFSVSVIAERNGRRERGSSGGGGRVPLTWLTEEKRAENFVREAVRQALINLDAIAAPAGSMPVVLGSGWPGVLLHEAVGHGLEGDFNRKGTSVFAKKMGEAVASSLCTVVDDGTLENRRGSLSVDDEGTPTNYTPLIENGKLVGYMQDKLNARLMNMKPTGNGRRESYAHLPMPRMTNTYMLPGKSEPEEIIASLDRGIYAVHMGGGSVDITSGRFVFSTSEAYLVEKGKIIAPVKGATLIGSGFEVMQNISMVGNDLAIDTGVGVCGKDGQSVPVGVGQPTLRVEALTVGGTG